MMRQLGLLTPLTEAPTTNREKRLLPSSSSRAVRKSPRLQALQDDMRRLATVDLSGTEEEEQETVRTPTAQPPHC